jgi:hypothetical protein
MLINLCEVNPIQNEAKAVVSTPKISLEKRIATIKSNMPSKPLFQLSLIK